MPNTVTQLKQVSMGAKIDKLFMLREKKRALEAQIKELDDESKIIEVELIERMDSEETDKAGGKKATASISATVVANVEDWDALFAYIHRTKYYHLLQRRVSDPAMRELFGTKGKVPGVVPFTKRKLNLRSL